MKQIVAKKSLGQNFLKSKTALMAIIRAGEVNSSDIILEIGPGKGALTEKILETGAKVIAIEKDDRLIEFLNEKFEKKIKEEKFLIELLEKTEKTFSSLTYDIKNIVEIMKLEQM